MPAMQATLFPSLTATAGRPLDWSWATFCNLLAEPPKPWRAASKAALPLVKLGRYAGNSRAEGSPLDQISGIEADYDTGQTLPETAAELLKSAGIAAAVVTTARHTPKSPRWRVFVPLSAPTPASERSRLLARLNGALGGILARESFTEKQCYFVGRLEHDKHYACHVIEGKPIDLLPELDAGAIGPPPRAADEEPSSDEIHALRLAGNAARWEDNRTELLRALHAINPHCSYQTWMEVSASLHFASGGKALLDWLEWSARSTKYPGDEEAARKWADFGRLKAFSVGTLYHHAQQAGWVLGMDQGAPSDQEIQAALDNHCTPIVTVEHCLKNWIWLSSSGSVLMRERGGTVLRWANVLLTYVASVVEEPDTGAKRKPTPVAEAWRRLTDRLEVEEVTYMPGLPQFCHNPTGVKSYNLWKPIVRWQPRSMLPVQVFLEHVEYLIPEAAQREQFLLWLAHAEQRPDVLPTAHWLMITRTQGIGRNWLSALLALVWPYQVALNVDLPHIFQSGFNGQLSRKIFACVDEIDVGGGKAAKSKFSTSLKALLTAQQHSINPKYGSEVIEANCTRWLLLSNSESAVPLAAGDRRLNVVRNPSTPKPQEYYTALYGTLKDNEFVNAVGYYLRTMDISGFDPGARAMASEMKTLVVAASRDEIENSIDDFCDEWPSCIAPIDTLRDYVMQTTGTPRNKLYNLTSYLQNTRAEAMADRLRLPQGRATVVTTRDGDTWRSASHGDKVAECQRGIDAWQAKKFGEVPKTA